MTTSTPKLRTRGKLLHQAIGLVVVPLVFELAFVALLGFMLHDLESALAKEAHAKSVVSLLTKMQQQLVKLETSLVLNSMEQDHSYTREYVHNLPALEKNSKALQELVKDNKEAYDIARSSNRYLNGLLGLVPQLKDAMEPNGDYNFVEFLHDRDFWMEIIHNTRQLSMAEDKLVALYGKTIAEATPKAVRAREQIKLTMAAIVGINIFLALGLAILFSKTTIKSLSVLVENTKRFSSGDKLLDAVSGPDEIGELDQSFREMAEARRRAELVRREMVAMVSHDLRTPLSSTAGYVTLLVQGVYGELEGKPRNILIKMESEMQRLIRLANDLLDIEQIESNSLELVSDEKEVEDIVSSAIEAVRGIAEIKEVHLQSQMKDGLIHNCDSDRIIQVLVNLLSNSIKFSNPGQTITLRAFNEGSALKFEVEDEGPGIAKEAQGMVFDRFKQLDQSAETRSGGSGLGLHICKSIIEAHGGVIGINSEPGQGACFWFTLP